MFSKAVSGYLETKKEKKLSPKTESIYKILARFEQDKTNTQYRNKKDPSMTMAITTST